MASILARVVLGASLAAAATIAGGGVRGAEAQPKPAPSAADKVAAGKLVEEANLALDAKEYDKAIELNQQAYALVPHPSLMFNMAQAHRLAGRPAEAAALYQRYLAEAPNGDQAQAAHVWLAETQKAAAEEAAAKEAAAAAAASNPVTEPSGPRTTGEAQPLPERADTVGHPGRWLRITGLVLGGVGLASVAFGVYQTTQVRKFQSRVDDNPFEEEDPRYGPYQAMLNMVHGPDGDKAETRQDISYIVGGALVVGGAVMFWRGHRQGAAQTTAWTPVVGPGYTGLAVSGAFF